MTWSATVAPGESFTVRLTFAADGTPALGPGGPAPWGGVAVDAPDVRLPRLVRQSLADLGGLLMKDGDDAFVAAGAPVVPDPVRPRLAVGRPAADAVRPPGWRSRRCARWPAARARARRPGLGGAARQDPPRGPQHHPRARRDEPAAGLLRHRRRDAAVRVHAGRRLAVGRRPRRRSPTCCPPYAGAWRGWSSSRASPAGCATSTCPGAAWPTRAGRTASTRCSSPTAGSPTRRSR